MSDTSVDIITITSEDTEENQDEIPVKKSKLEESPCTCPYCHFAAFRASFEGNFPRGKIHPSDAPDLSNGSHCKGNKHVELIRDHELLFRNVLKNAVAKDAES